MSFIGGSSEREREREREEVKKQSLERTIAKTEITYRFFCFSLSFLTQQPKAVGVLAPRGTAR